MEQANSAWLSARARRVWLRAALAVLALAVLLWAANAAFFWWLGRPQFWESEIAAYEQGDRASPPKPGVIVFTGSSSIRKWETLRADMQPLDVVNRGFGGSRLAHATYYARRIITPYRPRAVVLYADNDLVVRGWGSPQTVLEDFKRFVDAIHADLPEVWIYFISMKPAPKEDWPLMEQANRMLADYAHTQERIEFIDVSRAMLDSDGQLRAGLYGADPMHMNASGYVLWTSIIKPVLLKRFAPE